MSTKRKIIEIEESKCDGCGRCYDVAPDGQRFYAVQRVTPPPSSKVTLINLIQNWFEELKAKVPVRR